MEWRSYAKTSILSDQLLVSVFSFATGVLAGGFHTPMSLLLGLLATLVVRMFLASYTILTIWFAIAFYFAGFLWGIALFQCNRARSPWNSVRYPWKNSVLFKLYCTGKPEIN